MPKGASKRPVTHRGKARDECGSMIEATIVLATPTPPSLTPLAPALIFTTAPMPASSPPVVSLLTALIPLYETRTQSSSIQLPPIAGPSNMPTPFDEIDPDSRPMSIPEDAIFEDWRVIKELIERSVFPVKVKGIANMGFDDL